MRRRVYTLWRPSSRHLSATKSDTLKYTSQTGQSVRSTATQQWLSQLLGAGLYIHQKPLKFASRQSARLRVSAGTTPAPASSRPVNSRQFIPSRRNVDKSRQQNSNPASESIQQQTGNNDNNKTNNGSGNDQGNTNATLPTAGNKPATATSAKSPKRAELRQQDDCPACNNRGFQIVDEVMLQLDCSWKPEAVAFVLLTAASQGLLLMFSIILAQCCILLQSSLLL